MTAIGKGDFVECIDARPCPVYGPVSLIVGAIYTVDWIETEAKNKDGFAIHLVGVRSGGPKGGFAARRFKPISGGKPGMFNELLKAPTDAPTREPVSA